MILIHKEEPNPAIVQNIDEVKATFDWEDIVETKAGKRARHVFDRLEKSLIRKELFEEQHGLCAYCMRRFSSPDHIRIDHISSVAKFPEKALSYTNWVGVCDGGSKADLENTHTRVLCCDASKHDKDLTIDVYDPVQMEKISYRPNGEIFTDPEDAVMERDINDVLRLNGVTINGEFVDTSTQLVQKRKEVFESCERLFDMNPTAAQLYKMADKLLKADVYEEFVGVKVFFLRRRARSLEAKEKARL